MEQAHAPSGVLPLPLIAAPCQCYYLDKQPGLRLTAMVCDGPLRCKLPLQPLRPTTLPTLRHVVPLLTCWNHRCGTTLTLRCQPDRPGTWWEEPPPLYARARICARRSVVLTAPSPIRDTKGGRKNFEKENLSGLWSSSLSNGLYSLASRTPATKP